MDLLDVKDYLPFLSAQERELIFDVETVKTNDYIDLSCVGIGIKTNGN